MDFLWNGQCKNGLVQAEMWNPRQWCENPPLSLEWAVWPWINAPTSLATMFISTRDDNSTSLDTLLGGLNKITMSLSKLLWRYYYTSGIVLGTEKQHWTKKTKKCLSLWSLHCHKVRQIINKWMYQAKIYIICGIWCILTLYMTYIKCIIIYLMYKYKYMLYIIYHIYYIWYIIYNI